MDISSPFLIIAALARSSQRRLKERPIIVVSDEEDGQPLSQSNVPVVQTNNLETHSKDEEIEGPDAPHGENIPGSKRRSSQIVTPLRERIRQTQITTKEVLLGASYIHCRRSK
ncbi:hypothetical protein RCL1_002817 [Eukaryota sp. TZLM3-RCL]